MVSTSYLPQLPSLTATLVTIIVTAIVVVALSYVTRFVPSRRFLTVVRPSLVIRVSLAFGLGTILMIVLAGRLISQQLPTSFELKTITLAGAVSGFAKHERSGEEVKVTFDMDTRIKVNDNQCETTDALPVEGKIRLSWSSFYADDTQKSAFKEILSTLSPGNQLCLSVRLRRPRGNINPGGYDFQQWLLSHNYIATGYVVDVLAINHRSEGNWVDRLRWQINEFFQSHIHDPRLVGSVVALSIGEKSGITDEQWQLLQSTGTLHLVVISGLHVGIIAALAYFLGHVCAKLIGWKTGVYPVWLAPIISVVICLGYVLLAGFSLPTQRAFVMVTMANLLLATGRYQQVWLGYWLSMLVCLLLNPLAAHSSGFWLSFGVVAIILNSLHSYHLGSNFAKFLRLQVTIFLFMALPLSVTTQGLSLSALVTNTVAIPYVSFVVVPWVLVTSLLGVAADNFAVTDVFVEILVWLMAGFWQGLGVSQTLFGQLNDWLPGLYTDGFLNIAVLDISPWHWGLAIASLMVALIPLTSPWLKCLLIGSVFIVLFGSSKNESKFEFLLFDVGQGTASLVRVGNNTLVYDTGPPLGRDYSRAEQVIAPYLIQSNTRTIDYLMLSHGDSDHSSGLIALAEQFGIRNTVSGEPSRIDIPADFCERGQSWLWSNSESDYSVAFEVIWPPAEQRFNIDIPSNDKSCVLLIRAPNLTLMHAGDISKAVEWELVRMGVPDIDVLIAPHHGSKSSSSLRFLLATQPEHIVFSAGYRNRYRHPSEDVVARINKYLPQTKIWNTAHHGAIRLSIDKDLGWQIYASRKNHRRFWHSSE